jgi:phage-related tail protein
MIDFSNVPPPTGPAPLRYDTDAESMPDIGGLVDLNLDGAKRALKVFDGEIARWESDAKALTVNSDATAATATEMTGQVKRLAKQIDDRRKDIIAEPDSYVRKVNGFVKPLQDRLKALESYIKRKFAEYAYQVELERREFERKQREAAVRLQAELDEAAKAKGVEPVQVAPVAVSIRKEPTRSDSAVASSVMVMKHRVTDPALVPREYLAVDDAAIKAAIKAGIRAIPGVEIYEEAEVRVRRI